MRRNIGFLIDNVDGVFTREHDEGDFSLREISLILKEALGDSSVVSRFGGNEFVAFTLSETSIPEYVLKASCYPDLVFQQILFEADKKLYAEKRTKKKPEEMIDLF